MRSIFGVKTACEAERNEAKKIEADDRIGAELIGKAKAMEDVLLQARPARLEKLRKDHADDQASYKFECRRWGDFLSVFIERHNARTGKMMKYVGAINIREKNSIRLIDGHAPDLSDFVSYWAYTRDENGNGHATYYNGMRQAFYDLPETHEWVVECDAYHDYGTQKTYEDEYKPVKPWHRRQRDFVINHKTQNWPKHAEDDAIVFSGGGAIYAPAGMGQDVLDMILSEIGDFMGR